MMFKRFGRFLVLIAIVLGGATVYGGGWAVVTVSNLPDHVVAGQPVQLTFAVRQHGVTLLNGLRASIEARAAGRLVEANAVPAKMAGYYTAAFTLPEAGDWNVTIHSGFSGKGDSPRIVVTAHAPGSVGVPLSDAARGERLFAAKGCVTCHVAGGIAGAPTALAPELTVKRFQPEYLKKFLADPASVPPARSERRTMPNLQLQEPEIAALVAFLNVDGPARSARVF